MKLSGLEAKDAAAGAVLDERVDQELVESLLGSKPWLRCVSVFMWIAVMILLGNSGYRTAMGHELTEQEDLGRTMAVVLGLVYVFPAYRSWSVANAIGRLRYGRARWELRVVLEGQRRFFTFMGASLTLLLMGFVLMVLFAVVRARF